ncbi:MAG TPA: MBOAT family O-acyltransferase [Bacteroidia bacterium]|nr:MBOAT family protein [Bacteroidia bacterium]MBP7713765.1 MBOAT family protein [Bacteroidia bacterium]MBP8667973.1 MBOAT family protein [Bacteroidia bacterium]HOZ81353.1 MBOAT family O-acyltransferase [Bacteroidia bacterium]HOZ89819.1 MBOAT family O-acyltransferase [Bacteroidia bacterium]
MTIDWEKLGHQFLYDKANPLLFNSSFFLFYLLLFLFVFRLLQRTGTLRIVAVTLFSLYFFYKASGVYVLLVLAAAVIDFNLSNFIYNATSDFRRKALLVFSVVINLGLLAYFKYTNLLIDLYNAILTGNVQPIDVYLPIGISFYTFENLSYTIDVYRRQFVPVKKFIDYLFFLSFFPKLMMGPIVRAADFIPQIRKEIALTAHDVSKGLFLILTGLFKKVVISDFIYLNLVQYVFDDPLRHTGMECLFAVYGYALVIYCDFSGYSDMAIGIAKWIGIDININFLAPYQSASITEFWRRWHISLSSWLRDYLYIPLGGNRKGEVRTYINLFITMLLGGLWHGASLNFIFWGALHGVALAFHKLWKAAYPSHFSGRLTRIAGIIITFHFVCLCWIFFKCTTFTDSFNMIHQIVFNFYAEGWTLFSANYSEVLLVMLLGFVLHFLPIRWNEIIINYTEKWHWLLKASVATAVVIFVIVLKQANPVMPVYLQF